MKAVLLCLLIGGSGVGYVWQKNQIYDLGQQIRKRELRLAELEEQNEKLKRHLATLHSPPSLEAQIKRLNLGLAMPEETQKIRLAEPSADAPPDARRQYARQDTSPEP